MVAQSERPLMTDPWPWPGDTPCERARRIANSLLALMPDEEQVRHVRTARGLGESWLGANLLRWGVEDVITTAEAAELVHVKPSTIRWWHSKGRLANRGTGKYLVGEVLDAAARGA